MTATTRRFAGAAVLAVAVCAIVVAFGAATVEDTLAILLLVLCGLGLLALVRAVGASTPPVRRPLFERSLRQRPERPERPPELTRLEIDLAFGAESAAQLHSRVVPVLRMIAAGRLASRHGVDLERRPEAALELLGENVWELVRPDRPPPRDLLAPGLPLRRISDVVTRLEEL